MDDMFQFALNYAKARAEALGGNALSGNAAFQQDDEPVRRNLEETTFFVGDKIEIPSDENSPQWISAPLTKGGKNVTRALCKVTDANGNQSVKELFIGTLMKSVQNRETKQNVSVKGTITTYTTNVIKKTDVWKKLFGKTLEVTNSEMVPIIRRGFNGQPDRQTDTSVLTINVLP